MISDYVRGEFPSWVVLEAVDALDALSQSKNQSIEIMTVDYNMPGMDGIELIKQFRKSFPNAKIALLTGNIKATIKQQTEELGVQFIQKPITPEKVLTFVQS
jgi:CheY-like chemotaxis protein